MSSRQNELLDYTDFVAENMPRPKHQHTVC